MSRNTGELAGSGAKHQTIAFGLVNVPVRIKNIERSSKDQGKVSFNFICPEHATKCKTQRYCEDGDHAVEAVKGYQLPDGSYVQVDESLIDELAAERTQEIKITAFVDELEVSPLYYGTTYLLSSDGAPSAYNLLATAMRQADVVAIGNAVLAGTKSTAMIVIRWDQDTECLVAHRCRYNDALDWNNAKIVSDGIKAMPEPSEAEVELALSLIEGLRGDFDPSAVEDEYNNAKLELVEKLASGKKVTPKPKEAPVAETGDDLVEALKASVMAAKSGAAAKKPAKKKAKA